MATFEGTIQEFTRYIGPFTRIKVSQISSNFKKSIGKCQDCGVTESLDAAHIKGKERPILIANILAEFMDDDIIKVDINEFVPRFIEAHSPVESCIRILCNKCHRIYDTKEKNEVRIKPSEKEESQLIEREINKQMKKSQAVELTRKKYHLALTSSNTVFSNVVSHLDKWWLQTANDKFNSELNVILNNSISNKLYIFKIPARAISNPASLFKQRNDSYRKDCSDLYFEISNTSFIEQNGFDLGKYLIGSVAY